MQHSESIDQLATALAVAQGVMGGALKDSANPFFKSKYADLESVWTACRKALSDNGLAVIQTTGINESGICVTTVLAHKSGQWIRDTLPVNAKDQTPQGIGSAITYARRYALASMVGVYQTDDDAEAAHGRGTKAQPAVDDTAARLLASNFMAALKAGVDGKIAEVHDQANSDQELYQVAWNLIPAADRRLIKQAIDRAKAPRKDRANA